MLVVATTFLYSESTKAIVGCFLKMTTLIRILKQEAIRNIQTRALFPLALLENKIV